MLDELEGQDSAERMSEFRTIGLVTSSELDGELALDLHAQQAATRREHRLQPRRDGFDDDRGAQNGRGRIVGREPVLDECAHAGAPGPVRDERGEQVGHAFEHPLGGGFDERVEIVEVTEHRTLRDPGSLGDLGGTRSANPFLIHRKQRVDHGIAAACTTESATVDRLGLIDHASVRFLAFAEVRPTRGGRLGMGAHSVARYVVRPAMSTTLDSLTDNM